LYRGACLPFVFELEKGTLWD
jgi:hypothetical protein